MDFQPDPTVAPRLQNAKPRRWYIHFACLIVALGLCDFEAKVGSTSLVVPAYYMVSGQVNGNAG